MGFVNSGSIWGGSGGGAYEHDHNELYYLKQEVDVEVDALKQKGISQDASINKKADKTYVDTESGKKADKVHAHADYALKTAMDKKVDKTYVDTEVSKKSDASHVHANYALKTEMNNKSDKTHSHTDYALKTEMTALQNVIELLEARVVALETPQD